MSLAVKSKIVVFVLAMLVWLALTGLGRQEIISGFVVALLVSTMAGQFLITTHKQKHLLHRWLYAVLYFFKFLWEMIKANVHVAYIVLHPLVPIKPGIVKIKTNLHKDAAITVLTNSITLTPGTLTVDVNEEKKEIYVHWIDVKATGIEECTKEIGARFESVLREVFE
ncbi:Na+/H+ antiporter subunit E [candidate division KSB1 bacterium]|nr:Na+/H+ antiporter subunit E [candidate division KSB1 bacterium]RQW05467.1 MAG: cation:proton antiporter [candidate division KSB1 bacterium]